MRKKIENNSVTKNNHTKSSYFQEDRNCSLYGIILVFFLYISYAYGQSINPKTEFLPTVYFV